MSATLNNKRVMVTRPGGQAKPLCDLITKCGGQVVLFPTIEIRAITGSGSVSEKFDHINDYDFVIFISQNAVNIAFSHYLDQSKLSEQLTFVAIGLSTAKALNGNKLKNVIHAGTQADSEALLSLAELQTENVKDKKILIVRGEGGRELLAETLSSRGAKPEYVEVYQRCLPAYQINERQKVWQDTPPDAIIVTSNDSLKNLLELTLEENKTKLLNTPLVLMSKRTIELAKASGFVSKLQLASDKNDEGLLSALIEIIGDQESMTESTENKSLKKTEDKKADEAPSKTPASNSNKIVVVALILFVMVFSSGLFYGYKQLVFLQKNTKQGDPESALMIEQLDTRLNDVSSRFTAINQKLDELASKQDVLANLIPEPVKQQINVNEEYALAEIEHLLIIASYRLQLNHDVATALLAMEAADTRLKGLDDPGVLSVREQLIVDMNELRSLNQADLSGLGLFLSDLINRVDSIPLKEDVVIRTIKPVNKTEPVQADGVKQFFLLVWKELRSLIVITRDENVSKARLLPDEVHFIRANIKLELANARFSVFNRDTNNFRASIDHIQTWLNDYFDLSDASAQNINDALNRMKKLELVFPEIDISSSLESVRALIRNQSEASSSINDEELVPAQ